jgi:EmrB/QacA subfamily drug resistance transporter
MDRDKPSPGARLLHPSKWWMLTAVSMATFMLLLDVTVVNVALPDMQTSLHASFFDLEWVVDAYALTLAAFLLAAGSLADQLGRRRVFLAGLAVFTASSLACGLAANPATLDLARAVEGIGGAVLYAVSPAMIAHEFHGRQRGLAFGVSGGVTGLAVAIGPLVGGALTAVNWRWIFLLNVPVGLVVAVIARYGAAESRDPRRKPLDWPGVATFSLSLAALVFALIRGEEQGWTSPVIITLFAGCAVLAAAFAAIERSRRDPMIDPGLFRGLSFTGLSLSTLAINAALNVAVLFQVLYMQYVLGFSAFATGVRYLPLTLAVFVAAATAGAFSSRISARVLVGAGSLALGAGLLAAHGLTPASRWTDLLPGMLLAGAGVGLFNPARAAAAVSLVPPESAGLSSAVSETFQQGGVALGVAVLGSLAHARIRSTFSSLVDASHALSPAQARELADAVAAGRITGLAQAVPPPIRAQITATANQAFLSGINAVFWFGGFVALAGAVLGFALIRARDLAPAESPARLAAELERT